MRVFDVAGSLMARLRDAIATRRRLSRFVCGDCDRWEQCGEPPGPGCAIRAAQIERYGDRRRRRPAGAEPIVF